jgi:hypothetical protein
VKFPWDKLGTLLAEVAVAAIGAFLVNRVAAKPTPKPATPTPRRTDNFPKRADADITARGHAGIDERLSRATPGASAPSRPLPGTALRGEEPPDPDPTEPDALTIPPPRATP